MNIYLTIFFSMHGMMLFMTLFSCLVHYARISHIHKIGVKNDANWLNKSTREQYHLKKSLAVFCAALMGEAFSLWLLWMGGLFD